MQYQLPNLQETDEGNDDTYTYQTIRNLLEEMTCPEKMAVGIHAYWLTDTTHTQLCELKPRHGEFSSQVNEAIALVRQLQPVSLAELANEILLEDWVSDPSITLE